MSSLSAAAPSSPSRVAEINHGFGGATHAGSERHDSQNADWKYMREHCGERANIRRHTRTLGQTTVCYNRARLLCCEIRVRRLRAIRRLTAVEDSLHRLRVIELHLSRATSVSTSCAL